MINRIGILSSLISRVTFCKDIHFLITLLIIVLIISDDQKANHNMFSPDSKHHSAGLYILQLHISLPHPLSGADAAVPFRDRLFHGKRGDTRRFRRLGRRLSGTVLLPCSHGCTHPVLTSETDAGPHMEEHGKRNIRLIPFEPSSFCSDVLLFLR